MVGGGYKFPSEVWMTVLQITFEDSPRPVMMWVLVLRTCHTRLPGYRIPLVSFAALTIRPFTEMKTLGSWIPYLSFHVCVGTSRSIFHFAQQGSIQGSCTPSESKP